MSTEAITPERLKEIRAIAESATLATWSLKGALLPREAFALLTHIDTLTAQRENMRRELSESAGRNIDLHTRIAEVRELHKPRTEQVITDDCAADECEHEDIRKCETGPYEVCAACWSVAEEVDTYFMEESITVAAYPCPTIKALEAS